jgi:FkbM family methyltransferase
MSLSPLAQLIGSKIPPIRIVDVGAMMLEQPPYKPLLDLPKTTLVAFEPGDEEREKLIKASSPNAVILPNVVGRGGPAVFRVCTWNATNSLYEPNTRMLRRFSKMASLHTVAKRIEVETVSLDDVPEARGMQYLKIDVQGAELDVILGAPKASSSLLVAHVEVQFMPLYEGVPLQGDVDLALRGLGLRLHSMTPPGRGTLAPLQRKRESPGGQWLWADALYFRDFMTLGELAPDDLLALALIADGCYAAHDLALLALQHHDAKCGTELYAGYCKLLLGEVRAPEPLEYDPETAARTDAERERVAVALNQAEAAAPSVGVAGSTPAAESGKAARGADGLPPGLLEERGDKRLHIGGRLRKEGWTNLNALPGDAVDVLGDVRDLSGFQDGEFDMVYASHVMEHLSYMDVLSNVLSEIARITKPGGRFFVSVPDLKTLVGLFSYAEATDDDRFRIMRMMYGGQIDAYDFHFVGLWDSYLGTLLGRAGFRDVYRVENFGLFDDTSSLSYREVPISLNMVAVK